MFRLLRGALPALALLTALAFAGCRSESASSATAALPAVTLYKTPTCGCCAAWGEHVAAAGFTVETVDLPSLADVKREHGVPDSLASCHTALVGGYVVEGHVPAEAVRRLLRERPDARGLAVPGMPIGSPGMEMGDRRDPYEVTLIGRDGRTTTYARY